MTTAYLGIDIAKETFQVTLLRSDRPARHGFANSPTGFAQLTTWLQRQQVEQVHACLEATGRYGEALAEYLYTHHTVVSMVNPAQIKAYAQSQLRRNKTDKLDADVIADFCRTQHPSAWTPPAPELRELRALLHQHQALQEMHTQEANRLQAGVPSVTVRQVLQDHLTFLEHQLDQLEQLIREHIDRHPQLKAHRELLESIPGVGPITAMTLVAQDLPRFEDARAVVAYAGLNPGQHTSGQSIRWASSISRMGASDLRHALYWPAISARRFNPLVRALCERLEQRGKLKMQIIVAAMRKLLCLAYGVLKSGRPFDPNYLNTRQLTD